jgi:TPR repeat protein
LHRGDYVKAKRLIVPLATQGNAEAQDFLGWMYAQGRGVPKDMREAAFWYRKAAAQGDADSQVTLGLMYGSGEGVPEDNEQAVFWYRKAAEQGNRLGQAALGEEYRFGQGVQKDFVQAHKWFNLAAARGYVEAGKMRDELTTLMTGEQIARAQQLAREWEAQHIEEGRRGADARSAPIAPPSVAEASRPEAAVSGTGFFVSSEGHILTNAHVVRDCVRVRVEIGGLSNVAPAVIAAQSEQADLALLKSDTKPKSAAMFRFGSLPSLGEAVMVFGFPLPGVLASGGNLTTGQISALAGLRDDTRFYQISAPVQPGNSGGALVDSRGNVVGVVVGKLDAIKAAVATGDFPQNVNFAIKGSVAMNFLEAHGVQPKVGSSSAEVPVAELAARAQAFTVRVECLK